MYKHQEVRDLAWAITSPPLLQEPTPYPLSSQLTDYADWLNALDHNPEPLIHCLNARKRRTLGTYFEQLILFWHQHASGVELLHHQAQLIRDGHTIGEVDLLHHYQQQLFHVELSVKFYLWYDGEYHGPGVKDTLSKRINTFDRQCALLQEPENRSLLALDETDITPYRFIKGRLFYPYGESITPPAHVNPEHTSAQWAYAAQANAILQDSAHWAVLPKSRWLSTAIDASPKFISHIVEGDMPQQLVQFEQKGTMWHEVQRLFVVPNHWPNLAQ